MSKFLGFFSLSGRASRTQYWLTLLINVAVLALAILAFAMFEWRVYGRIGVPVKFDPKLLLIALAVAPLCLMALGAGLFVPVKRMHDRNKSGWWLVIGLAAPLLLFSLVGNFDGIGDVDQIARTALGLVGLSIWFWIFVELGFMPGVHRDNRFEPDR